MLPCRLDFKAGFDRYPSVRVVPVMTETKLNQMKPFSLLSCQRTTFYFAQQINYKGNIDDNFLKGLGRVDDHPDYS